MIRPLTDRQIADILKNMYIIYDTREHNNAAFVERLKSFPCPAVRRHLNFGDYTAAVKLPNETELCLENIAVIERKEHLAELAMCFTSDRPRFIREFERAAKTGAKIYLLVERASWEKAYRGLYRSDMSPQAMVGSLTTWLSRYNCQLLFCETNTTGKLIYDVMYHELRELLKSKSAEEANAKI